MLKAGFAVRGERTMLMVTGALGFPSAGRARAKCMPRKEAGGHSRSEEGTGREHSMRKASLRPPMPFELRAFPMYASQFDTAAEHLVCRGEGAPRAEEEKRIRSGLDGRRTGPDRWERRGYPILGPARHVRMFNKCAVMRARGQSMMIATPLPELISGRPTRGF
jgi:hypothetical protein